ncbi:MAG TPA: radical SAM protein [Candidatus Omnitrophota bacterium]|nr:radical SAM protein [Candidatus Omnitrophota bacterium]
MQKVVLIQAPTGARPIVRDMAGGLGFDGGQAVILPPLELLTMATHLRKTGYDVGIIDSDIAYSSGQDLLTAVGLARPRIIISTVSLPSLYSDCAFAQELRSCAPALVFVKTGISYAPLVEEILRKSGADICLFGECDDAVHDIIQGREFAGTARLKEGVFSIEPNRVVMDLDSLEVPARELLDHTRYHYIFLGDAVATMQTSRGCPFACSYYCPYPLVQGNTWRFQSAGRVIAEIENIVRVHGLHNILFRDAVFTLNKDRVLAICNEIIQKKIDFRWWCETRVDCLSEELLVAMKKAGCQGMNIGVETGDPEVMKREAKIGLTITKLEQLRAQARRIGLRLHFLLMLGLPHESRRSLYKTYSLVSYLKPDSIGVCIITPYPGTPLFAEAKEKGWIETYDWSLYGGHSPVMHTDMLSAQELVYVRDTINRLFYAHQGSIRQRISAFFERVRFQKWSFEGAEQGRGAGA